MTSPDPRALLGRLDGGRVLDVATGSGGFVELLLAGLRSHEEIVGIDANEERAAAFEAAFDGRPGVRFERMDAHHLDYPDASFDTAAIGSSLHHLEDPATVLREMVRVLRPGGHLVVGEMFRDRQSAAQRTHVLLHHWWAAVDRACGEVHRETYRRAEIVSLVEALGLGDLVLVDIADLDEDPRDPTTVAELEAIIDRYRARAVDRALAARGERLRQRLRSVGAQGATQLLAIGRR